MQRNGDTLSIAVCTQNFTIILTNEQEIPQSQLIVYPNPASSFVSFGSMDYDTITISNMLGQTVRELNTMNTFDASSLYSGSYIIRATKSGKSFFTILQIAR